MKLFGEKVKQTFTNSPFNIIQVKDFQETFFDVYEIELNNGKYPVEKISEQDGIPMVNIPIVVEGQETLRPFLLTKGKENALLCGVNFDTMFEDVPHETIEEEVEEPMVIVEEKEITKEDHSKLLEEIAQAKKDAREYAEKIKRQKLQEANKEIENKQQALEQMLENARSSLVDEFVTISEKVRNEFVSDNDERFEIINHIINEKIHELANNLREALIEDFDKSEKTFGDKLDEMVAEVYAALSPRVNKELSEIVENFEKKIETFSEVNSKLDEKLDKNVNKALSRIGNVDRKYESLLAESETKFDEKLQKVESSVVEFYQEKLTILEDKTLNLNEDTKKYFVNLLNESKRHLLEEIEDVKKEKSVEFIIEKNGEKAVIDEGKLITKLETALNSKISDVETSLRKYVSVYAGGGGTVATQYQDGGVMRGDLTIEGDITAQSINISSDQFSDYSQQGIYKAQLTSGSNSVETFPIRISPSLSNAKLFISFISPTKKTAVEAFVMHMDTSCFINVYSVIHSDNISPLLLDMSCNTDNNFLNVVTNVTEDCVIIISGFATYADDTNGLLFIP